MDEFIEAVWGKPRNAGNVIREPVIYHMASDTQSEAGSSFGYFIAAMYCLFVPFAILAVFS